MTPSALRLLLAVTAVVAAAFLTSPVDSRSWQLRGNWSPIKNLSDLHVKEIAEFAVSEYNKKSKATLQLQEVLSGETQMVAGTKYRLVLMTKAGMTMKDNRVAKKAGKYEAIVWEKALDHSKKLISFKALKT